MIRGAEATALAVAPRIERLPAREHQREQPPPARAHHGGDYHDPAESWFRVSSARSHALAILQSRFTVSTETPRTPVATHALETHDALTDRPWARPITSPRRRSVKTVQNRCPLPRWISSAPKCRGRHVSLV